MHCRFQCTKILYLMYDNTTTHSINSSTFTCSGKRCYTNCGRKADRRWIARLLTCCNNGHYTRPVYAVKQRSGSAFVYTPYPGIRIRTLIGALEIKAAVVRTRNHPRVNLDRALRGVARIDRIAVWGCQTKTHKSKQTITSQRITNYLLP